ncbi:hypothetical protein Cflav_PD5969 [Pedosphaera parvula Ellin514]|uniref:Uncharacterized protein n=1 Tax=Pedosphaera parvula (strain Ellin514) TaxID=320771 RepID=B9X9Z3_PEDPL|nr:hypothetical protein Cflav_PD5969 [Pedosphaera parvula Ellin514]
MTALGQNLRIESLGVTVSEVSPLHSESMAPIKESPCDYIDCCINLAVRLQSKVGWNFVIFTASSQWLSSAITPPSFWIAK